MSPLHVPVVRLTADQRDEIAGQRRTVVRVGRHHTRRTDPLRHVLGQVPAERHDAVGGARAGADDPVLEPGGVGEQHLQRDRLRVGARDLEGPQVRVDVRVQVEATGLHLLHHRGRGEQLGDRRDAHERPVGVHRHVPRHVGPAEPARVDGARAGDDGHHHSGRVTQRAGRRRVEVLRRRGRGGGCAGRWRRLRGGGSGDHRTGGERQRGDGARRASVRAWGGRHGVLLRRGRNGRTERRGGGCPGTSPRGRSPSPTKVGEHRRLRGQENPGPAPLRCDP